MGGTGPATICAIWQSRLTLGARVIGRRWVISDLGAGVMKRFRHV